MKTGIAALLILLTAIVAGAGEQPGAELIALPGAQAIERQLTQAGIRPEEAASLIQAMRRARFSEEQMLRAGEQLSADGGPADAAGPVLAKIHEGIAKGIPPETILTATARVRDRYRLAERLALRLAPTRDDRLTATLADCLAAGLTEQEAMRITASLHTRTRDMSDPQTRSLMIQTLLTARTMVRQNVSSGTTAELIGTALARGYGSEEMRTLRQAVESSSADMEATARRFGEAINRGAGAGQLQSGPGDGSGNRSEAGSGGGAGGSGGGSGGSGPGGSGGSGGSGSGGSGAGGSGGSDGNGNDSGSGGSGGGGGGSGNGNGSGGSGNGGGGGRS